MAHDGRMTAAELGGRGAAGRPLREVLQEEHEQSARLRRSTMQMRIDTAAHITHATARPAEPLKGFDRVVAMLEERLRRAEQTSGAVASAQETIKVDLMLARAKAEAEAWVKGKQHELTRMGTLSPLEVQAVVAERNELRHRLRECEMELRKIEIASGGQLVDIVKMCHHDMYDICGAGALAHHLLDFFTGR